MVPVRCFMVIIPFLGILTSYQLNAQSPAPPSSVSVSAARSLDALLQGYAYRAFNQPRTGVQYEADVPSNISGIKVSVIRLRSGSLWLRGVRSFNEFEIPVGVIVQPYVERLALVYQNLGNLSSVYYQLPGYTFVAPVVGLLAYDATNLSATNLLELDLAASMKPISMRFTNVSQAASGLTTKCVWFNLNGLSQLNDSMAGNVCTTYRQGHFSIVVNSSELAPSPALAPTPAPTPAPSQVPPPSPSPSSAKKGNSNTWKIVVAVVGGFLALVLLVLLAIWIKRYRQDWKMKEMVQHAESGEVLQKHRIGDAQLPKASVVRTRPTLESDLAPQVSPTK